MSTNKKFRVQNGLDVTGEVTVGGVTVINADGTVVSDVSDQLVPLQADVAALETAVENIIGTSPETLDTLQEIVAAYEGADSDLQLLVAQTNQSVQDLENSVGAGAALTVTSDPTTINYEEVLGAVHTVFGVASDKITWRSSDNYNSLTSVSRNDGNIRWQNSFEGDRGFYATHDAIFISFEGQSVDKIVEYPLDVNAINSDTPTAEYHGHTGISQNKYTRAMYADDDIVVATSSDGTGYMKIWTRGADGSNPINVSRPSSNSDWETWGTSVKRVNDYLFVGGYKVVSIHNLDGSFVQSLGPFSGVLPDTNAYAGGNHSAYGTSAIAGYGNTVVIGAPNTDSTKGRAMVFDLNDLGVPPTVLASPDPYQGQNFGGAVDISADYVVVAGAQWYNGSGTHRGRVAVYDSSLNLLKTLEPTGSYLHYQGKFGTAVSIRGTTLLVGVRAIQPLNRNLPCT